MIRTVKVLAGVSVCFALMLPLNSFAQKGSGGNGGGGGSVASGGGGATGGGGGNGGGGKPVQSPPPTEPLTLQVSVLGSPSLTGVVNSDQPATVTLQSFSDGKDAPVITVVSGPPGLILEGEAPIPGDNQFGHIAAEYVWTPSRDDIGSAPSAVFEATTASGARVLRTVVLGPVLDVPPGVISGLTATLVGNGIQVQWASNSAGPAVNFDVTGCYHTLLPGTNIPYALCDQLSNTSTTGANVPASPVANRGQPGVPVNYYGIFVQATTNAHTTLLGSATANVQ